MANVFALFGRRAGRTLRELTGAASASAADGYLQYAFNFRPLLSDIRGVFSALSRFERHINDLVTRSGRVQVRHYSTGLNEFTDWTDSSDLYITAPTFQLDPACLYVMKRSAVHSVSKFHVQVEFNYNFTEYQREHARLLGLLDAFGVNLNPSIIWNAIPYSFLVDWVVGVSRFLDQFKIENMKPKINILRSLWSIKRERTTTVTRGISGHIAYPFVADLSQRPCAQVHETAYRRQVGTVSEAQIQLSGLSSNEVSLGAALILSRRR